MAGGQDCPAARSVDPGRQRAREIPEGDQSRRSRVVQIGGGRNEIASSSRLVRRGFEIVERNYRTRWGELDIVAFDGRVLAFCEVN